MNIQLSHAGRLLLIGAVMILVTMALHPVGGSIDHLKQVRSMIIGTHSLAILSIPFLTLGFWGVTRLLGESLPINQLAFTIIFFGLIAVMLAAATNGLVLPFFLDQIDQDTDKALTILILDYSFALNQAMDYIFIGSCSFGIGLWSFSIFRMKKLPIWLGILGLTLFLSSVISVVFGHSLTDLFSFRLVIAGLALWILILGVFLIKQRT